MTKQPYIQFFKKAIILILLLVIIDIAAGKILGHFYLTMKSGQSSRITYALNKSKEEIMIFGSSRANHHYVPPILEDSLHLNCYNAGIDGQSILYHYAVLKTRLLRSKPQIVLLDVNTSDIYQMEASYNKLYLLLPYYKSDETVREIVNERSKYEHIKAISNLYRYNSFILPILLNNIMNRKEDSQNGYAPLNRVLSKELASLELPNNYKEFDTTKINAITAFLKEAKNNNCKVFVCVSPMFKTNDGTLLFTKKIADICAQQNVPFFNYATSADFYNKPEYFDDITHLNNKGAEVYTKMVYADMRKYVPQQ